MNPTNAIPHVVPGTVHLVEVARKGVEGAHAKNHNDIVLHPQPSDNPEDPLRWTRRRKMFALSMVFVYTLGVGIPTTLHYSVISDITRDTGITTTDLTQGNGVMFLFLGWACLFWQPIAMTYGRRGVYLLSTLLTVPIMVWTAHSSSAGEWYAHRIIIGIVCSPIESLPEISIPDLFFAHERGTWMSTYVFILFESNFIAPLIAGWLDDAIGWRWTMYFGACIAAAAFVILFFFMEETLYFRNTVEGLEADENTETSTPIHNTRTDEKSVTPISTATPVETATACPTATSYPPAKTYTQKLRFFISSPGRPTNKQMFTMMYRPLLIILQFPSITWAGFIYGINLAWYNVLNATASPILTAAPYNWTAALVGCAYVGPIIGAAFGCLWAGTVADRLAIHLARRNNGIREPEQRLWPLAVAGIFSAAGLILWGVGAYNDIHWVGLIFGLGMLVFGLIVGGSIGLSYAVDCFKEISGESMAAVIVIRNTIGFGFSYAITPWYTDMGLQDCFITAGMVSLACTATFLLMIWKGKDLRRFSAAKYWKYVATSVVSGH